MKLFHRLFAPGIALALSVVLSAQVAVRKDATGDSGALTEGFTVPSGATVTFESGSTLLQPEAATPDRNVVTLGAAGDGATDDAPVLNTILAEGGRVYFPAGTYLIGEALRLPDNTHLTLHPEATIKAKDASYAAGLPCLATNDDPVGGNINITIEGGVWDLNMDGNPTRTDAESAEAIGVQLGGIGLRFRSVTGLKLRNMRVGNGRSFYISVSGSHGLAEDIEFFTPTLLRTPTSSNQDGIHISGNSSDWVLRRLRGTTGDNIVGIGSDEVAPWSLEAGPVARIRIEDTYSEDSMGIGMYAVDEDISDVTIDGLHGAAAYSGYAVRFASEDPGGGFGYPLGGQFKDVTIRNQTLPSPVIAWTNTEVRNLVVEKAAVTHTGINRLVQLYAGANIEGLALVDNSVVAVVDPGVTGQLIDNLGGRVSGLRISGGAWDRSAQTGNQQGWAINLTNGSELSDGDVSGLKINRAFGVIVQAAGTALTSVTHNATTGLFTKTNHGLGNGARVRLSSLTGGSALNTTSNYYVVANGNSTSTFYLSATRNGAAITGGTNLTAGTVTPITVCGSTRLRGLTLENCRRIWQGDTLYSPGKITMSDSEIGTVNVNGTIEDAFQFNAGGTPTDLILTGNTGTRVKRLIVLAGGSGTTRVETAANRIATVDQRELHLETGVAVSYSGVDFAVNATANNGNATLTPLAGDVVADPNLGVTRYTGSSWLPTEPRDQLALQGAAPLLKKIRAAVAVRRTGGTDPVRVLAVGDSTSTGYGSVGATYAGAKAKSYPRYLAQIFSATGFTADEAAFCGAGADEAVAGGTLDAYDPRVVLGSGWASTATNAGIIGRRYIRNNSTTGTLSFTPGITFDRIEVVYTSSGSFTVDIGGGTLSTPGASTPLARVTVNCTSGNNTINLTRVDGDIFILSVNCYLSTGTGVSIINAGNPGATSATLASAVAYGPIAAIQAMDPHLSILSLGINDINAQRSAADYKASMAAIVDACQETGDVVLVSWVPFNSVYYSTYAAAYLVALRELAAEKGCLLIDHTARFESYTVANSLGYLFDNVHPTSPGYYEVAGSIAATIRRFF